MSINIPQNFYRETLTRAITLTGATNIYVSALPTASEGYIVISPANTTLREIIKFTAKGTDGNGSYVTVTLANRGLGGTTAQTHVIGEPVRIDVIAETIKDISDAIDQIEAQGATDASTTDKGIAKLSVAPVSATEPIAVGDNDLRLAITGQVFDYSSDVAPNGFVLARGDTASRTELAALFALYGTRYGVGDGSTTFHLPNFGHIKKIGKLSSDTSISGISATNLVSYYNMEGNSTDIINAYNGSDTDITYSYNAGRLKQGASFNGTSSKITVADTANLNFTNNFSVSAFVKLNTHDDANRTIVSKATIVSGTYRGWNITKLNNTGGQKIKFEILTGTGTSVSITSNGGLTLGWHHILVTMNAGALTMYIDGVVQTSTASGTMTASSNPLYIGCGPDGLGYFWSGDIDEVVVTSRVLTPDEILTLNSVVQELQDEFTWKIIKT